MPHTPEVQELSEFEKEHIVGESVRYHWNWEFHFICTQPSDMLIFYYSIGSNLEHGSFKISWLLEESIKKYKYSFCWRDFSQYSLVVIQKKTKPFSEWMKACKRTF